MCVCVCVSRIAVDHFAERLFVGFPKRLTDAFTLPLDCLVEHKGFLWLTYGGLWDIAEKLALSKDRLRGDAKLSVSHRFPAFLLCYRDAHIPGARRVCGSHL